MNQSESINALRFLSMDAVQKANSGHPGMPMGMAEIATALWKNHLNHNPNNPHWFNRDRFVLSNGHGSMLLYSLLHLTGYNMTIDDLREEDFILRADEEKSYWAKNFFRLTIGNKRGTEIILNGKKLVIPESKKNVVKDFIINSKLIE